jgi:hypothetical protein
MPSSASELMPVIRNPPVPRHFDRVQRTAIGQPEKQVRPGTPNGGIGLGLGQQRRSLHPSESGPVVMGTAFAD